MEKDSWEALLRPDSASLPLNERARRAFALAQSERALAGPGERPNPPLALAAEAGLWDIIAPMAKMGFDEPMSLAISELASHPKLGGVLKELLSGGQSDAQKKAALSAGLRSNNPTTLRSMHEAGFGEFKAMAVWKEALRAFNNALIEPAHPSHIETLKGLLSLGMAPDILIYNSLPLPFLCVDRLRADLLEELISNGVSPDMRNAGVSLLAEASAMGAVECAQTLLAAGASVNDRLSESPSSLSALELCMESALDLDLTPGVSARDIEPYCKIAAILLSAGADPNEPGGSGVSPMDRLRERANAAGGQTLGGFMAVFEARECRRELEGATPAVALRAAMRM